MRRVAIALMVIFGLAACSPPEFEYKAVGEASAAQFTGKNAFEVAVAGGANPDVLPASYALVTLPRPTADKPTLAIMPWHDYQYFQEHGKLGPVTGANITDLMAFQAQYRADDKARNIEHLCAPTKFKVQGKFWVAVVDRGTNFGLFTEGCEWALVVIPPDAETGRVL